MSGEIRVDALRSWADRDGLWIDPVGGSNLFVGAGGDLVPIDVIPVVASGNLLETLVRALNQVRPSV